ncbi:MAG: hypothetical protein EP332_06520 [Bacteroidetes bacterium]|nr:MAG: hypothetical protein EP332_06520 [Bacteroidota bacterium]
MKKKQQKLLFGLGVLVIALFFTPIRDLKWQGSIDHSSVFRDGEIDFARFLIYLGLWASLVYLVFPYLSLRFLKQTKYALFGRRILARCIDMAFLSGLVIVSMFVFYRFTNSIELTDYIFMPLVSLVYWLLYFAVFFKNGKTPGMRLMGLSYLDGNGDGAPLSNLLLHEFVVFAPAYFYAQAVGLVNYYDGLEEGFKQQNIEDTYWFWPVLILAYGIVPFTALIGNRFQSVIDRLSGLQLRRIPNALKT